METETVTQPQTTAIEFSKEIGEICAALAKAQAKIQSAERDAENPYFNSTYSSLAAVWDAVRGPLTENGLSILQGEKTRIKADLTGGEVDITTMLLHASGQWFRTTVTLPVIPMSSRKKKAGEEGDNDADRAPGRITPQAIGSAITYGRRYGLESVTGTAPEAKEDDDGNSASGAEKREPIPASGTFEDVIEAVTFEEKKKKAGGTFIVSKVKTGKHGDLECWESVGNMAQGHAGTGIACMLKAEKSQYGWKLLEVHPIQAGEAPAQGAPAVNSGKERPSDPAAILADFKAALAGCKTLEGVAALKDLVVKKSKTNSAWFTAEIKGLLAEKHRELGGQPAPTTESNLNPAAAA